MSKKEIEDAMKHARKSPKKDSEKYKITELTDTLQRLQAEFENYQKRCARESAMFREYSRAELVGRLLPILDSIELAIKNKDKKEDFIKGVELIFSQLHSTLEHEGLKKIDCIGKKLDSHLHDVMLTEKSDKEEDTILEELQKGYMFKDRVLRHSKVKVAK